MTKTNRKQIFIFSLVLVIASLALVAFIVQPSAEDLLTQSISTLETVTNGHAIVEMAADLPDQDFSGTVEVWAKRDAGPNGEPAFRVEVLEASKPEAVGMIAVADGSQFWLWNPIENKVLVGTAVEIREAMAEQFAGREFEHEQEYDGDHEEMELPETPEEAVAKLLEYFDAERAGSETMAGVPADKLRLIPIAEKMPEEMQAAGGLLNLWLRTEDQLPLGIEYTGSAAGSGSATAALAEINIDLDDEIFTFIIPEGAEVINIADLKPEQLSQEGADAAVDFDLLSPNYLPEGAGLVDTVEMRGTIVQRYNLPVGSFTIAQGPASPMDAPEEATAVETITVRGVEGTLYTNDEANRTLLTWIEGDVGYLVGGDLTPDEAVTIAGSLN